MADGARAGGAPVLFEGARPLSKSLLWKIHREYFERAGVEAWSHGDVPFMLTSGPILARRYAQVIEGFAGDCAAGRFGPFDVNEPLYVIELGAGSGRLAYLTMRLIEEAETAPMRVVYVLTDLAAANVEFFHQRQELQRLVADGRMDFARFEAGEDSVIHLEHSGIDLAPRSVANPLAGVANYLFCATPQDLYSVLGDELREEHVAIFADSHDVDTSSGDFMKQILLATAHAPAKPERYGDERLARVLRTVGAERGGGKERFLFPHVALKAINALSELSGGRLMMIVGDRVPQHLPPVDDDEPGVSTTAYRPGGLLGMGIHGASISLPVDFDVLRIAAAEAGADMILQSTPSSSILVASIIAGDEGKGEGVRLAFKRAFGEISADDLLVTVRVATAAMGSAIIDSLFATIRVSSYDPYTLVRLYPALESLLADSTESQKDELERIAGCVYELSYPLEEVSDLAFGLGSLLGVAGRWEAALEYFNCSRKDRGPRAQVCFNTAMCYLHLDRRDDAVAALGEALELDPDYEMAAGVLAKVLAGEHFDANESEAAAARTAMESVTSG